MNPHMRNDYPQALQGFRTKRKVAILIAITLAAWALFIALGWFIVAPLWCAL